MGCIYRFRCNDYGRENQDDEEKEGLITRQFTLLLDRERVTVQIEDKEKNTKRRR